MPSNHPTSTAYGISRRTVMAAGLALGAMIAFTGFSYADPVTIKYFSWETPEKIGPMVDAFMKANPDIKVEISRSPPVKDYVDTLQTRLISGDGPDVMMMAAENKNTLIQGGFVKDLTNEPFTAQTAKGNQAAYSIDGKVYAESVDSWGAGILYNKALLDKAGVTALPQSWDEFIALCQKLKAAGINPYSDSLKTGDFMLLVALLGNSFTAEGGGVDAKIFSGQSSFEKEWTGPLTQYIKLYDSGAVSRDAVGIAGTDLVNEFANGKIAMIGAGPWNLATIRGIDPKLDMHFMPVPGVNKGDFFIPGAPNVGYAINAASAHPAEAEKFVAFAVSKEGVELYQKATSTITDTADYTPVVDPMMAPLAPAIAAGHIYLPQTAWMSHQDALYTELVAKLQELVGGKIQPVDVAKALDAKLKEASN